MKRTKKPKTWLNPGVKITTLNNLMVYWRKNPCGVVIRRIGGTARPMPLAFLMSMPFREVYKEISYGRIYTAVRRPWNPNPEPKPMPF